MLTQDKLVVTQDKRVSPVSKSTVCAATPSVQVVHTWGWPAGAGREPKRNPPKNYHCILWSWLWPWPGAWPGTANPQNRLPWLQEGVCWQDAWQLTNFVRVLAWVLSVHITYVHNASIYAPHSRVQILLATNTTVNKLLLLKIGSTHTSLWKNLMQNILGRQVLGNGGARKGR